MIVAIGPVVGVAGPRSAAWPPAAAWIQARVSATPHARPAASLDESLANKARLHGWSAPDWRVDHRSHLLARVSPTETRWRCIEGVTQADWSDPSGLVTRR